MPLQNRVSPFGELFASSANGTLMGNRGGRFHSDDKRLTTRRWASRQWICCVLDFKNRQRDVWGRYYTELFFLDEVTALAAGHRPCFECRRREAELFANLFSGVEPNSVHSRARGNPAPGSGFRGDERVDGAFRRARADEMDAVLHRERLDGKAKRVHRLAIDSLPDGAIIVIDSAPFALRGNQMLPWKPEGYGPPQTRPSGRTVDVLTPPSILAVLVRGYTPSWHPIAGI